jgi:glucosylceramidase
MNSYYYIGHFSKFIRPGARRISSSSMSKALATTAFANPDGSIAAIVMNGSDKSEPYYLWVDGVAAQTESPAHSIQTVILPPAARGLAGRGPDTASTRRD